LTVDRRFDSAGIQAVLRYPRASIGINRLPVDGRPNPPSINWQSPVGAPLFKDLFRVAQRPCREDSLLSCEIGAVSESYAVSYRSFFNRLSPPNLADALDRPVTWDDLARYLELGLMLKTPKSGKAFRKELDSRGIRIDRVFEDLDSLDRDPWFGLFYRSACDKSFIYGVKYLVTADSIRHLSTRVFYRFQLPYGSMEGVGAVIVLDSLAEPNMERLEEFLERHRD
jgi:hypothetical protein